MFKPILGMAGATIYQRCLCDDRVNRGFLRALDSRAHDRTLSDD
jgi:hypothetical protein